MIQNECSEISINRWTKFFHDYSALESDESKILTQWQDFFNRYRMQYVPMDNEHEFTATIEDTHSFFTQFKRMYSHFFESGGELDVCEIMSLKRDEVRNCSVLAWFLNSKGSHGQGNIFFKSFLNAFTNIDYDEEYIKNYVVQIEKSYDIFDDENTDKNSKNRVDILIENKNFLIFLEAKIYAPEGKGQLSRYSEQLDILKGKRDTSLFYLTIKGGLPANSHNLPIIPISWKNIGKCFETTVQQTLAGKNIAPTDMPFWAFIMNQFCNHIKQF